MTAEIVSAYVRSNSVAPSDLTPLIARIHETLALVANGASEEEHKAPEPAVSVRRSVTPDYIICLEDGKRFKSLKRHLRTHYQLTPEEYRRKWNLPPDYPMVAPNYAKARSQLAKKMGLGRRPASTEEKS